MGKLIVLGRALPDSEAQSIDAPLGGPAWAVSRPRWIERAVSACQMNPTGGWFVLDGSRRITNRPRAFVVAGASLVVFRDRGGDVIAGPDQCPHMGARLSTGCVRRDAIICPWHGLALGAEPYGSWQPIPAHDDGVLVWVRLGEPEEVPTVQPIMTVRPDTFVDGVIRVEARCDPRDVLANRFDPWHGTHFHPYAFKRLEVLELGDHHVVVRVAKRIAGPIAIEVAARFHSPERRTIVMTIVEGEGEGSVVETHATPIGPGRTAIIEASLAASNRRVFRLARPLARLLRPLLERSARRLWIDDAAYAERLYEIRARDTSAVPISDGS